MGQRLFKRSRQVRLVLIGGLSTVALSGCSPGGSSGQPNVTSATVYSNNHYLPGVGYYHAPFRAWYKQPYNYYDSQTHRYYYAGQWADAPYQSITNVSYPTPQAVQYAQAQRTDIPRGGFGSSSGGYSSHYS